MLFLIIKYSLGSMVANLGKKIQTEANIHIIHFAEGKKSIFTIFFWETILKATI